MSNYIRLCVWLGAIYFFWCFFPSFSYIAFSLLLSHLVWICVFILRFARVAVVVVSLNYEAHQWHVKCWMLSLALYFSLYLSLRALFLFHVPVDVDYVNSSEFYHLNSFFYRIAQYERDAWWWLMGKRAIL